VLKQIIQMVLGDGIQKELPGRVSSRTLILRKRTPAPVLIFGTILSFLAQL
jgi:hypothetical protein